MGKTYNLTIKAGYRSGCVMMVLVQNMEEQVRSFFKNYGKYVLSGLVVGILAYFMMMSQNLVNDLDGIWHPSNFIAGDWEISLGRGLQRYADRARFGIVSDPFNTLLTLLLVTVANAMILMRFDFDSILYKGIFLTVLVANPVICNTLSYSYMSVNFGLAYFFGVVAFSCVKNTMKDKKQALAGILSGAVFLGISMAFYQSYICVTCVLIVMCALKMLLEKEDVRKVLQYIGTCACTVFMGGGLYLLITKLLLFRAGIQMASYKGASDVSILTMLLSLPQSLGQCYIQFWNYFCEQKAFANLEFIELVIGGLFVVYLVAFVMQFVRLLKRDIRSALLFTVMVLLLPVACCFVLLIAVGNTMTGLMSQGIVLCTVMIGMIVPEDGKAGFWVRRLYMLFLVAFAWFQLSAVTNDQVALKEGKTATITLTENIVSQIYEEGYLDEHQIVAFVGRPGNNDRFVQSTAYQMANGYAKFGCWSTGPRNNRMSWMGVTSNFLGVHLSLCEDAEYEQLRASKQVANMPEFPTKGSICVIDDMIVVKVSELY